MDVREGTFPYIGEKGYLMSLPIAAAGGFTPGSVLPPDTTDDQLIAMWLHGRPMTTQRKYEIAARQFLAIVNCPLRLITLPDVQRYVDDLAMREPPLAIDTQKRLISSVKSLLTFAHRTGYTPFNVGAMVKPPKSENRLAERILPESEVLMMIHLEKSARNRAILRILYYGALRVSEAAGLKWRNMQESGEAGQVTVFGKGSETRTILLDATTWLSVMALRQGASLDSPVFVSRTGHYHRNDALDVVTPGMTTTQIWRIVKAAAKRAGLEKIPSPHWLRHAHASHALDHDAPIHLVQTTLGHKNLATTGKYTHARPKDSSSRYLKG